MTPSPYGPSPSQRSSRIPPESKSFLLNGATTINISPQSQSQSQSQRTRTESSTKREMLMNMCTCGSGAHGSPTHQPGCDPIDIHRHHGSSQHLSSSSPTSTGSEDDTPILVLGHGSLTLGPPSEDMDSPPAYRVQEPGDIMESLGIRTAEGDHKT